MIPWPSDLDAYVAALLLAIAMLAGWAVGWWRGWLLYKKGGQEAATAFDDAVTSLLGLLLAFTFSMSLVKHEQRRTASVTDSNAVGDFASCVGLLDDPPRARLQALLRRYVGHRLAMAEPSVDDANFERKLDAVPGMHAEMLSLVNDAVRGGTPVVVPLVNTYNAMTSSHASRLAAVRDRLPRHVVFLLMLTATLSVALMGKRHGVAGERRPGAAIGYVAVVCTVVWVTLDLDQPRRGLITVSQEPMRRLLDAMREDRPDSRFPKRTQADAVGQR